MERLTPSDAVFLEMEAPAWHEHVGGIVVVDASSAPRFGFDAFKELVRERLPLTPRFSYRVKEVPFGLDLPVWIHDENFDLANHLHRAAGPSPGGQRELAELAGDIMSHQLDRRRPLWEMWYVDGLQDGRVALVAKTHHCMMDGASGQGVAEHLFDLEPDAGAAPAPKAAPVPDRVPSGIELAVRGLATTAGTPFRMTRYGVQLALRGLSLASLFAGKDKPVTPLGAPATPWNATLGPRRHLSFVSVSLKEIKAVRERFEVKVNDVILALVATALRGYLLEVDALPTRPLVAGVPVSTREIGDTELGNKFASMFVALPVQVDDPVERLSLIHASATKAKAMTRAIRTRSIQPIAASAPPALMNLAFRAMYTAHLDQLVPAAANVLVSNVAGPSFPLYSLGARVEAIYPIGPLMMGMGLNCTVFSYLDYVNFGLQCDPDLLAEPAAVSDRIPIALAELTK